MNPVSHEFAPEEVMAFADGEVSEERAAILSKHVVDCAECSVLVSNIARVSERLASWHVAPGPSGSLVVAPGKASQILSERGSRTVRFKLAVGAAVAVSALLLFVIATPNLMRSRMASNEASAVASLRTLNTAAALYLNSYGHYPFSLRNFGPSATGEPNENGAGLVDPVLANGRKSGYLFLYDAVPVPGSPKGGYIINADPIEPGTSGYRHFSTDQTAAIHGLGIDSTTPGKGMMDDQAERRINTNTLPPMIVRSAELRLLVGKLDEAREAMDRILRQHKGYIGQLSATVESGSTRVLNASLRVPADQLDTCISDLKRVGQVTHELLAGDEVTQQHTDLAARLKNAWNTEQRLNSVVSQKTGPVKEILDVEKEAARVRGEIEQMEAEQKALEHRVQFASIDLRLTEEYKAQLTSPSPSTSTRFHNALVTGYKDAVETVVSILLFFAEYGPSMVAWLLLVFPFGWFFWRRWRRYALGSSVGA